MDVKDVASIIGMFITGGCLGTLIGAQIIVHRLSKDHFLKWRRKIYTVVVERSDIDAGSTLKRHWG